MTSLTQNFRKWWQPPKNIRDREEERRVTFLELHVPLTVGIVMTGAAVLNVVEHAGEPLTPEVRWLLVGPLGWRWSALQHSSS